MTNTAWPLNAVTGAPSYTGKMVRQSVSALLAGATATRPLGARSGVRIGTPTTTVTATSTVWTVNPHSGVLDVETSAIAGAYLYAIDTAVTGAVTAADATYPRVDIVWVQIADPAESDGTTTPGLTVGYTAGTSNVSGTLVVPSGSIPPRSMTIANINVPVSGGGSPSVTWLAPYATAPGGIIPVRTQAERDAITIATADFPVYVDRKDTGTIERNVGSGWKVFVDGRRTQDGSNVVALDVNGQAVITFPVAFGSAPTVIPAIGDVNGTAVRSVTVVTWSATSFTVQAWLGGGTASGSTTIRVNWVARGAA